METRKARDRRLREGWFDLYAPPEGSGIDVGAGADPIHGTYRQWDKPDGDATDLVGVPSNEYRTVYASHVLEHLDRPLEALRNWYRVLRPGGHLIVVVPHRDLYERRNELPSTWNPDHKTFWLPDRHEPPCTWGLREAIETALSWAELLYVRVLDDGYSGAPGAHPEGEYSIEAVVRKPDMASAALPRLWRQDGKALVQVAQLPDAPRNIAIARESGGIGDAVRVLPACEGLRRRYPDARLWVFTIQRIREIYGGCPAVDHVVAVSAVRVRAADEPPDLHAHSYLGAPGVAWDLLIDLRCPGREHEVLTGGEVTMDRVELFLRAASLWPVSEAERTPCFRVDPLERAWAEAWLVGQGLPADNFVALAPFSDGRDRTWPLDRWADLAGRLERAGMRTVALDGLSTRLQGWSWAAACFMPLAKVAAILSRAALAVTTDSGLFHLAGAVGTPALGLFGWSDGEVMCRPYPGARWLAGEVGKRCPDGCRPPCYGARDRGWSARCQAVGCAVLNGIAPEAVLDAAREMLGDGG